MDKKRPPDQGNRDLDTSSTDDKINTFEEVADSFRAGIQPAVFLTHLFLQKHPILLEEGCLTVNWNRIPGLYCQTDKLLMVSVTDKQWEKWGRPGGGRHGSQTPGLRTSFQTWPWWCVKGPSTMPRTPKCKPGSDTSSP